MGTDIMTSVLLLTSAAVVTGAGIGALKVLDRAGDMVDKNSPKFSTVLDNTNKLLVDSNKMMDNLGNKVDDLGELINDARSAAGSIQKAFDNVDAAAVNLNKKIDKGGKIIDKADKILSDLIGCITNLSEVVSRLENKGCNTLDGIKKDINVLLNEIVNGNGKDGENIKGLINKAQDVLDQMADIIAQNPEGNDLQGIIAGLGAVIDGVRLDIQMAGKIDNLIYKAFTGGEEMEPGLYVRLTGGDNTERYIPLTIDPDSFNLPGKFDNDRNKEIINIIKEEKSKGNDINGTIHGIYYRMQNSGIEIYQVGKFNSAKGKWEKA